MKKLFLSCALVLGMIACTKEAETNVSIESTQNHDVVVSEPLQFSDDVELSEAFHSGLNSTKAENGFVSYASTVMMQDGYEDQPYAIDSDRIGSILNADGEAYFGDNIFKVSKLGSFVAKKECQEVLRNIAENENLFSMLGEQVKCPLVSKEKTVYSINGCEDVYYYDTFDLMQDSEEVKTKAPNSRINEYKKTKVELFGAFPGENWGNTFTVPKSGDQKVKFTDDKYCNDTKIYHKDFIVGTDTGIKTKTMRKKLFWKKTDGDLEAGIINTVVYEKSDNDYARFSNNQPYNFNEVVYGGSSKKFIIATIYDANAMDFINMGNSRLKEEITKARIYAKSLGYDINVDGIRIANDNEAITRFPDKIEERYAEKIEMSFLLDFGGKCLTRESINTNVRINAFSASYYILKQELYGKSIRGKGTINEEIRGSKMIYTY